MKMGWIGFWLVFWSVPRIRCLAEVTYHRGHQCTEEAADYRDVSQCALIWVNELGSLALVEP